MKTGIFYGSTTGVAEDVAKQIAAAFAPDPAEIKSAAVFSVNATSGYDLLILGSSTWGCGELQEDWEKAIEELGRAELSGKTVALFGIGDGSGWADTFVDALGILYETAVLVGAKVIGKWPVAGYEFSASRAQEGDCFVGLAIDDANQGGQTAGRVQTWVAQLKKELAG